MKTNYQRGFRDDGSFRDRSCQMIAVSRLTGAHAAIGNDFTNGHRGQARAKAGAKKYVRTRDRVFGKRLARRALRDMAVE